MLLGVGGCVSVRRADLQADEAWRQGWDNGYDCGHDTAAARSKFQMERLVECQADLIEGRGRR